MFKCYQGDHQVYISNLTKVCYSHHGKVSGFLCQGQNETELQVWTVVRPFIRMVGRLRD